MSGSHTRAGADRRPSPGGPLPRLPRCAAALAAASLVLAASTASAGAVQIQYKFRPGTVYDQAITMTMTIAMEMEGVPEDQAAMAGALGQGMTQEMAMNMAMELGEEGEDGAIPIEIRLEEMTAAMVVAGQRMENPMGSMAGMTLMKGRISPDGKISGVQAEGMEGVSPDMLDRLMQFIPEMPARDLQVGDTFEIPVKMSVPIPNAGMDLNGSAVYTLTSVTGNEASFDLAQKFSLGADAAAAAEVSGMGMKLTGEGAGTAVFDLEEGIFSRIQVDMKMNADISGTPEADPNGPPPATFRMNMTASGPIEMTLTRRGAGS